MQLACERRRISGCHLVPLKNNVCEPEPENDFCDVGIQSQSQFSSTPELLREVFAARSTQVSFYHGIWLAKEKQKSLRHRNRFLARVRRHYFSAEPSDSRKYVCICRLACNLKRGSTSTKRIMPFTRKD